MEQYIVGIDAGGTFVKAGLFDASGRELAVTKELSPHTEARDGKREQDPDALWHAVCSSTQTLLRLSGIRAQDIAAISVTGYGSGLWLVDADGVALGNGILSTDVRTELDATSAVDDATAAQVERLVSQRMWSGQTAALLRWFDEYELTMRSRVHRVLACKDYIRARLCGDMSTDHTDAGLTGLCDIERNEWSADALRLLGISRWREKLPTIGPGAETVGVITAAAAELTGLAAGTPVVRGVVDVAACALASRVLDEGHMSVIAGTFGIDQTLHPRPRTSTPPLLQCRYITGDAYLASEGGITSASNLEWCCRQIFRHRPDDAIAEGGDIYRQCNDAVARAYARGRSSDMMFFPYLFGGPDGAPAGLLGAVAEDGFDDAALAVYEGIAFAHKGDIELLLGGDDAARPTVVRMSGGASHSPIWPQIFADVLGLRVDVADRGEIGVRGAAITAAVAVGMFADFDTAAAVFTPVMRSYEPDPQKVLSMRVRYDRHRALTTALSAVWNGLDTVGDRYSDRSAVAADT
ncbi:FGGY-family carbohydrate kinase [Rhodococcus sp. AW25M09]|uniref:FGGY-family carbohydrate kinase n=1 Tax=Rhodococcus sp. AW25M09 TaxID=1268303 RepID=UPI00034AEB1E|nr:FGGY-family carbohydrate kinase [Rhodococcus sp. AW25M09]